eukprot:CAMPEP_0179316778 /NCGR_PEP_ID=MMETSP0797-20121207/55875_1 /TAXON_ID=47934 /ORGANISM="Dinophysis acuminata, Strain DAEP01" /LENGTH=82 /DNA_ID=CAMNT_0021027589 /DNA_START=78 /DNA_END=322 /DNA_ORIENTATION=-
MPAHWQSSSPLVQCADRHGRRPGVGHSRMQRVRCICAPLARSRAALALTATVPHTGGSFQIAPEGRSAHSVHPPAGEDAPPP